MALNLDGALQLIILLARRFRPADVTRESISLSGLLPGNNGSSCQADFVGSGSGEAVFITRETGADVYLVVLVGAWFPPVLAINDTP